MRTICVGIAVFALTTAARSASAQVRTPSEKIDETRKGAKAHVGTLYLRPTFDLTNFGVDTNVFNDATERKDFTFTVKPGARVGMPISHRALITGDARLGMVYFQKYGTERSVDPEATIRAELFSPKITFFVENAYLSSRQRQNFEIDLRTRRHINALSGGLAVYFSPRTQLELSNVATSYRYTGEEEVDGAQLRTTLDRNSIAYAATFRSQRTPKTMVAVAASVTHDRFVYEPQRNADILELLPSLKLEPRALVNGSLAVGYKRFHTLSDQVVDYSGLLAHVDLGYTLLGATRLAAQLDRDVDYSYDSTRAFYLDTGIGANVRRQLFGDNDAILTLSRHSYSYREMLLVAPVPVDPTDVVREFSVDVGHRLRNFSRVGFTIARLRRASNFASSRNYEGWRYGVSFTYGG